MNPIKPVDPKKYPNTAQLIQNALMQCDYTDEESDDIKVIDIKRDTAPKILLASLMRIVSGKANTLTEAKALKTRFREFDLNLDHMLEKLFKEVNEDKKLKFAIGKVRLTLGHSFTETYLLPSLIKRDKDYEFALEFLNSLSDEEIDWFFNDLTSLALSKASILTSTYDVFTDALFKIKHNRCIFEQLLKKSNRVAEDSSKHFLFKGIEMIMIEILKRLPEKDLKFKDFSELYPLGDSYRKHDLAEIFIQRFGNKAKDQVAAVFLKAAQDRKCEEDCTKSRARSYALEDYASFLKKEESVPELINIIQTDDEVPVFYGTAVICLSDEDVSGQAGKEALVKEIARRDYYNEPLLPMAYLFNLAHYERYRGVFTEVLSKVKNLSDSILQLHGTTVCKMDHFNRKKIAEASILDEKLDIVSIIQEIGILEFFRWAKAGGPLGENILGILEGAIELDTKNILGKNLAGILNRDFSREFQKERIELVKGLAGSH